MITCFVGLLLALSLTTAWADKTSETKDTKKPEQTDVDKKAKPCDKAKAEKTPEAKPEAKPEPKKDVAKPEVVKEPEPTYPVDPRKLRVTIKMKNGKVIKGVVKHFLISEKLVDHIGKPVFTLCDGPTVEYEMDEFSMPWEKVKSIVFNKKNKENGEKSCYEDSDKSQERWECLMTNEYYATSKDKSKKGKHTIQDRNLFRFVVDTGKKIVNVDSHLGKVKITNERDESRKMDAMEQELKTVFKTAILSITFK